jgi:hypothetical protein
MVPSPYKPLSELGLGEFRATWRLMSRAISHAREVLAIGFSFMDPHFNAVMRRALGEAKDVTITVVSPDAAAICKRLAPSLPKRLSLFPQAETMESFMRSFRGDPAPPTRGSRRAARRRRLSQSAGLGVDRQR